MKNLEETFGGIRKLLYLLQTPPKDQSVNYIILLSEKALARNLKLKNSVEKAKTREIVLRCRDICKLFLESYLKIETNIHVVICTTE